MIKNSSYVYTYGIFLSLQGFYFGYEVALFNSWAIDFIKNIYHETNIENQQDIQSNFGLFYLFGGLIGCLFAS